jgi:hypothetical protein
LAQILMRTDLGDEPQIVRGDDDPTPPEGGTTRMPQTFSKPPVSGINLSILNRISSGSRWDKIESLGL